MKYYWLKLTHQHGQTFLKTVAEDVQTAIQNCVDIEGCDISQLEAKEVPLGLFSLDPKIQFEGVREEEFVLT